MKERSPSALELPEALWMPVEQLGAIEDQLAEDHFHILVHFLGLTP